MKLVNYSKKTEKQIEAIEGLQEMGYKLLWDNRRCNIIVRDSNLTHLYQGCAIAFWKWARG